jgi:tetratricopeptide (TPR) repeat protein
MRFIYCLLLLCSTTTWANSTYEPAQLISVTDASRTLHIVFHGQYGGVASANRVIVGYHLNVAMGDVVYIGRFIPHTRWSYAPTDLAPKSTIDIRLDGKTMYIKRPNGKEIKTAILSRIDKAADDSGLSGDAQKAAAVKHHEWGKELLAIDDVAGSIKQLKMALRMNPEDDTYYDLDLVLRATGDKEGALQELQSAVRLNASNVKAHCLLGWTFYDKGQLENAIGEWQTAVQTNPQFAFAHYSYGKGLEAKGDLPRALEEYRTAVQLDHNQADAKRGIERISSTMGTTTAPQGSSDASK